ncbi:MAG: TonB-dependent receptor plug domain-containing protein, partial [Muribaculaceae bacterium]|nr:TonB-dependent receptor plug domain-containing protein [Muribaculaceae bacterium]
MNLRLIIGMLAAASPAAAMLASEPADTVAPALDEVVVTGTNSRVPRRLLPYTVSVVDARELESSGSTQVLSILSGRVPSLFVTERSVIGFGVSNGGAGHIKLRGVGGDRASGVLMMVDGQPQFAGIYSHHVADSYQKDYVERVEVLRGPGSVLYGSNAMAGAINVITRGASRPGTTLTLQSQYGSFNTWLSSLSATSRYGRFSSLLSLSYNRTDGTARQFDFRQADGYVKVGYDISSRWKTYADFTLMNFKGSDPIYPTLKEPPSTGLYRQNVSRGEGGITLSNRYDSTDGTLRLYYNFGHHLIDDPTRFKSLDDRIGMILYQNFSPWHGSSATVGFDFDAYSGEIPMSGGKPHQPGAMATISRKSIIEYSPYVTLSQRFWQGILNVTA